MLLKNTNPSFDCSHNTSFQLESSSNTTSNQTSPFNAFTHIISTSVYHKVTSPVSDSGSSSKPLPIASSSHDLPPSSDVHGACNESLNHSSSNHHKDEIDYSLIPSLAGSPVIMTRFTLPDRLTSFNDIPEPIPDTRTSTERLRMISGDKSVISVDDDRLEMISSMIPEMTKRYSRNNQYYKQHHLLSDLDQDHDHEETLVENLGTKSYDNKNYIAYHERYFNGGILDRNEIDDDDLSIGLDIHCIDISSNTIDAKSLLAIEQTNLDTSHVSDQSNNDTNMEKYLDLNYISSPTQDLSVSTNIITHDSIGNNPTSPTNHLFHIIFGSQKDSIGKLTRHQIDSYRNKFREIYDNRHISVSKPTSKSSQSPLKFGFTKEHKRNVNKTNKNSLTTLFKSKSNERTHDDMKEELR